MSLENIQQTLQRVEELQRFFEHHPFFKNNSELSAEEGLSFQSILEQFQAGSAENGIKEDKSSIRRELDQVIEKQAIQQGVDPNLVRAVVQAESAYNPHAVSPAGAQGLMQLMPGTAQELGVRNSFNPMENVRGGTHYLKNLIQKYQSVPLGLAAYNAGPGAVDRYGGIPPYQETQNYVQRVLNLQQQYALSDGGG